MNIVTGRTGKPHVTSQQQRDIYAAIFGNENIVLNIGKCLKAELQSSNTIRVYDGVLVMQGCVASIDEGAYDDVKIENGTQGQQRIDLIVAKYENTSSTGYESVTLQVIKGAVSTNPVEPQVPAGNIRQGNSEVYFPLYKVTLNGVNIEKIETKFEVLNAFMKNPKILFEGSHFMTDSQTITLSEGIERQNNGVIIAWSAYVDNGPKDYDWHYFFVPKSHVKNHNGQGVSFNDALEGIFKYLYISNESIRGYKYNNTNGTQNGISYNNRKYCLRYVIGI